MRDYLVKLLGAGAMAAALGAGPALAGDDFGSWDANDDGVLTEQEFKEGWGETGAFSDFDVDGDGRLTEEEYDDALSSLYGEDNGEDPGEAEGEELEDEVEEDQSEGEFGDEENFGEW